MENQTVSRSGCIRVQSVHTVIFSTVSYFCCRLKAVNVWSNVRVVPFIEDYSPVRVYGMCIVQIT
jgi:hypothetical protein